MDASQDSPAPQNTIKLGAGFPADHAEKLARAIVFLVFLLSVTYTLHAAHGMSGGMKMPGGWIMPMMWMVMPGHTVAGSAFLFLVVWEAMMVAMMLPSAWPMLQLYGRVARHTGQGRPTVNTISAGAGYFAVWGIFGAIAFAIGLEISSVAMASPRLSREIPAAAGVSLVLAGLWQLSPLKQVCLKHCREPLMFLAHAYKPGAWGAFRVGLHHGAFCAACCWALMVIQMVLGVMNLTVMIVVATMIAAEKLWKRGPFLARAIGLSSIAAGVFLLARSI